MTPFGLWFTPTVFIAAMAFGWWLIRSADKKAARELAEKELAEQRKHWMASFTHAVDGTDKEPD